MTMACRSARRAILRRVDGDLPIEAELELDAHLAGCPACRRVEERAMRLEEALVRLPEPATARLDVEGAVRRIRARMEARDGAYEAARGRRVPIARLAAAAAAVLLLAALWHQGRAKEDDSPERDATTEVAGAVDVVPEPARSAESVAGGGSHAEKEGVPFDRSRLEAAREEVRALLASSGEALPGGATREEALAFAERFDEGAARLRASEWPVRRIVEGMLESDDLAAARAAARYLGVRGDTRSRRALTLALSVETPAVVEAATRALGDLGADGLEGLRVALAEREVRALAIEQIITVGGAEAADALSETLIEEVEAKGGSLAPSEDLLAALQGLGEPAVLPLLEIGERGWLERDEVLRALEGIDGAGLALERRLAEESRGGQGELALACAARLAPDAALAWCLEHQDDPRRGQLALRHLPEVPGVEVVDALLALADRARLSGAELERLTARALERDAARFARRAEELVGERDDARATELAELLVAADAPGAGEALAVLASYERLEPALRQAAALAVGERGDASLLPRLTGLFATLGPGDRYLASACLISIRALGGEDACRGALEGVADRATENILSLLLRRRTSEGRNPSIYKLSRELKPILADRERDQRRTSS